MKIKLLIVAALVVNVAQVNAMDSATVVKEATEAAAPVLEAVKENAGALLEAAKEGVTNIVAPEVKSPSFLSKVATKVMSLPRGAWDLAKSAITWAPGHVRSIRTCERNFKSVTTKVVATTLCVAAAAAVIAGTVYAVKTFCLEEGAAEEADADARCMEFCDEEACC